MSKSLVLTKHNRNPRAAVLLVNITGRLAFSWNVCLKIFSNPLTSIGIITLAILTSCFSGSCCEVFLTFLPSTRAVGTQPSSCHRTQERTTWPSFYPQQCAVDNTQRSRHTDSHHGERCSYCTVTITQPLPPRLPLPTGTRCGCSTGLQL